MIVYILFGIIITKSFITGTHISILTPEVFQTPEECEKSLFLNYKEYSEFKGGCVARRIIK